MEIKRELYPSSSLEAFADKHGLVLCVTERALDRWQRERKIERFLAYFERAEVKECGVLRSAYGNGATENEAIADYVDQISGEVLVINAYSAGRVEIRVPRLTYEHPKETA
jgi:hypothetical protein